MACSSGICLPPETIELKTPVGQGKVFATGSAPVVKPAPVVSNRSLWAIFLGGFIGGLLALLTPCVFPMIPLTVSFFTKRSKTRASGIHNALIYALSIIVIYVSLGLIITLALGPDALNALSSNSIINLVFFIIFVVFAISFFGAFEITFPSKWFNASDRASDRGGLTGIFFMAFTLALVSFSCTGPIIGSLLVQVAVNGSIFGLAVGMTGFALALALPFALFAAFPGWLNSLPKSGGWLNSIKVSLGFIELALSLKFLSAADMVYHWEFLTREVFLAIWIAIFALFGLYLIGKIRLPHDDSQGSTSVSRLLSSIVVFAFVVYLVPGLWGAPLKFISGFPPPSFYSEGWTFAAQTGNVNQAVTPVLSDHEFRCPLNLNCFHDYDEGMAYARKVNKPVMLDFTGWSCINCRKMEDNVWRDNAVLRLLSNDFILISLYVDDKTQLPVSEQYISKVTRHKVKTLGNKWSDFQTSHFHTNSQAYYVLMDFNGNQVAPVQSYDTSIQHYVNFLNTGLKHFRAIHPVG